MYFRTCSSSKDLTHSLYGTGIPWAPLEMLNTMKSVVASQKYIAEEFMGPMKN